MNIKEYIDLRISELRAMQANYESNHEFDPSRWPVDMTEEEWFEQEVAVLDIEHGRSI